MSATIAKAIKALHTLLKIYKKKKKSESFKLNIYASSSYYIVIIFNKKIIRKY